MGGEETQRVMTTKRRMAETRMECSPGTSTHVGKVHKTDGWLRFLSALDHLRSISTSPWLASFPPCASSSLSFEWEHEAAEQKAAAADKKQKNSPFSSPPPLKKPAPTAARRAWSLRSAAQFILLEQKTSVMKLVLFFFLSNINLYLKLER